MASKKNRIRPFDKAEIQTHLYDPSVKPSRFPKNPEATFQQGQGPTKICASPKRVAPWMTRSSLRLSAAGTLALVATNWEVSPEAGVSIGSSTLNESSWRGNCDVVEANASSGNCKDLVQGNEPEPMPQFFRSQFALATTAASFVRSSSCIFFTLTLFL